MDNIKQNPGQNSKAFIMLVDNNSIDNFVNQKLLEQNQINNIKCFSNAPMALNSLTSEQQKYDLILVEIYMPLIDGFKFLDLFNELSLKEKQGKIIFLSALVDPRHKKMAFEKGIALIEKPLTMGKLIDSLLP